MKRSLLFAMILTLPIALQGCIPMAIGAVVGYQIAKDNAHSDWCAQHVGDPSCHP